MGRTGAEALMEKGAIRGKRETLIKQLRLRFKKIPKDMRVRIESCNELEPLEQWLERFATATTLEEVGILPPS